MSLHQFQNEPVQVLDVDEASGIVVKLCPNISKVLNAVLFNWKFEMICLLEEGINYDGNEQVDKYLRNQNLKQKEEDVGGHW